ncbi:MAG: glycerol-3-phosphate 1-O-acyltransferase PlsY [Candidatus Omnitrophota bacterium]
MDIINLLAVVVLSYLIGSLPTAYIFGKLMKNIDIREHGSGNVGATNAFRVLGKGPGSAVLVIDIIKGIIPIVVVAGFLAAYPFGRIVAAVAVVCGHNWTCFLNFKGGKGIATSLGVLIGLTAAIPEARMAVLWCVAAWAVSFLISGIVSISSIIAAVVLPIVMIAYVVPTSLVLLSVVFCIFVVFRHRPNIQRFLKGQESGVRMPWHPKVK